jgi:hypothetical protein
MKRIQKNCLAAILMAFLLILIAGCESPVKVDSESDPVADLTSYKSFYLLPMPDKIPGADPGAVLRVKSIVRDAVRETLIDKGYTETSKEDADFAVNMTGKVVPKTDVTDWGYSYAPRGGWGYRYPYYGYGTSNVTVDQYDEGSLILEIFDNEKGEMVWVGWGTARTRSSGPDPDRLEGTIMDILARFPSKPGSMLQAEAN